MRTIVFCLVLLFTARSHAQELFVNSEPASNIPARSISLQFSGQFASNTAVYDRPGQRYIPELLAGLSKKLMIEIGGTFSDMHTPTTVGEAFFMEAKYRFLAHDDIHKHFRMSAFILGSNTKSPFHFDEANLKGDKSGVEPGVIATQLCNRFAFSGTVSNIQVLDKSRGDGLPYYHKRYYQYMDYSLSTGYLLFPREYKNYKQVNINLYLEALAQQTIDGNKYYIDLAPALQAIFFSNTKLSVSYRGQVSSNMERMSTNSWMVVVERSFLNVVKQKKKSN